MKKIFLFGTVIVAVFSMDSSANFGSFLSGAKKAVDILAGATKQLGDNFKNTQEGFNGGYQEPYSQNPNYGQQFNNFGPNGGQNNNQQQYSYPAPQNYNNQGYQNGASNGWNVNKSQNNQQSYSQTPQWPYQNGNQWSNQSSVEKNRLANSILDRYKTPNNNYTPNNNTGRNNNYAMPNNRYPSSNNGFKSY